MTIKERQDSFVELFNSMPDWTEKFQYLIELGENIPEMPEEMRTPKNQIECNSKIYYVVFPPAGKIHIEGWSNSPIPSGLIAVMKEIFEGCDIVDLRSTEINFHIRTNLLGNLTRLRQLSLLKMIGKLKQFCN